MSTTNASLNPAPSPAVVLPGGAAPDGTRLSLSAPMPVPKPMPKPKPVLKSLPMPARRRAGGMALVTAIFLLVVLAGLGVAVVTLTTNQQAGSAQDELGTRAYLAARAGGEWALYQALESQADARVQDNLLGCPAVSSFTMPQDSNLAAFTVTVRCAAPVVGVGSADRDDPTHGHVQITVTACNSPGTGSCETPVRGADYVQRVIRLQI